MDISEMNYKREIYGKFIDCIIDDTSGKEKYILQSLRAYDRISGTVSLLVDPELLNELPEEKVKAVAEYLSMVELGINTFTEQIGAVKHE